MKRFIKTLSVASILALGLNAQTVHLEKGWNNVGLIGATAVNDFNNSSIDYVWKYNAQNGKWYFYSTNEEYNNQVRRWISDGYTNYGLLRTLNTGDAVWIKSESAININVGAIAYTNIRGFVKNAVTNNPINHFSVIVDNHEKVFNDTNGTFDIQNITVAQHSINVSAQGYQPVHINLDVENPTPVDLGQIQLVPQSDSNNSNTREVNGEILNAVTGEKIDEPVRIRLFNGYNNTEGEPVFDTNVNNGEYDINLSAGTYTVVLDANGFYETTYNHTFASENNDSVIRQNLVMSPIDSNVSYALRATLTWGEYPTDLDSHFLAYAPDSNHSVWHVYYDQKEAYINNNGELINDDNSVDENESTKKIASLDVDDTDSFGPEHVTLYDFNTSMKYVYYVWNYSQDGELKNSNAEVKVYYNNHLYDFHVPYADGTGWKVFEIDNGVLMPCQTNCMVSDDFDIYNLRTTNQYKEIKELIDTANQPK